MDERGLSACRQTDRTWFGVGDNGAGWLAGRYTSDCYELMMPGNLGAIKVPTAEMSANALHYLTGN